MNAPLSTVPPIPAELAGITEAEWRTRLELAACYRLFAKMGWVESIFNHITLRVPGDGPGGPHYLINPFGLLYEEVTAANLLKVDRDGQLAQPSSWKVNPAGFVIHTAIHAARPDAHCIIHTHTTAGIAVATKAHGLRHDNFYGAQLIGRVAYHDFEGITVHADEQPRMLASMGDKAVLILRNHGLLVAGPDLASTFRLTWTLQRACEVQVVTDAMGGPNAPVSDEVAQSCVRDAAVFAPKVAQMMFEGALRRHGVSLADVAI